MKKKRNYDTVIFAAAMIAVSGACLAYNIRSADNSSLTAPMSELMYTEPIKDSALISVAASANLNGEEIIEVSASPKDQSEERVLLPPIVVPQ